MQSVCALCKVSSKFNWVIHIECRSCRMCRLRKSWKHDYIPYGNGMITRCPLALQRLYYPGIELHDDENTLARPIAASRVCVFWCFIQSLVAFVSHVHVSCPSHCIRIGRVFTSVPRRISDSRPRYVNPTDITHITKSFAMFSHPPLLTQTNAQDRGEKKKWYKKFVYSVHAIPLHPRIYSLLFLLLTKFVK